LGGNSESTFTLKGVVVNGKAQRRTPGWITTVEHEKKKPGVKKKKPLTLVDGRNTVKFFPKQMAEGVEIG